MATTPKNLQFLQEIKAHQLGIAAEAILQSTVQFYHYRPDNGRLAATASGVLLTVDGRFFVVSAAHVLAKHHHNIFVLLGDAEITLGGKLYCTNGTKADRIDLAVLELTDATQVAQLQREYQFLTLADMSTSQTHRSDLYLLVGYPATKTKVYKETIAAQPYPLQAQLAANFDYARHGFRAATHFALEASGDVVTGSNTIPHKCPRLEGMSGGGLWHNGNYLLGDPAREKRLVGIIIEQVPEHGRKALLATRVAVLLEFMRQRFDLNIPASRNLKVKLTASRPVAQ